MNTLSEKLVSIAENTVQVREVAENNKVALSGSDTVTATGVCDVEHEVKVKLKSKNLFNINAIPSNSQLVNNGDGTLTVSKYGIGSGKTLQELCPALKVGDVVKLMMYSTPDNMGARAIYLYGANTSMYLNTSYTITQEMLNSEVFFYCAKDSNNALVETLVYDIQLEYGDTSTEYTPYIEDFTAVRKYSKQILPFPYDSTTTTKYGMTITVNDDGTITLDGTNTEFISFTLFSQALHPNTLLFKDGVTYHISGGYGFTIRYLDESGTRNWIGGSQPFTWQDTYTLDEVYLSITANSTYDNALLKPFIEKGTTATEYEPYYTGSNLWDEQVRGGHYSDKTGEPIYAYNVISSANPIQVSALRGQSIYNCGSAMLYAYFYDDNGVWISPQRAFNIGMAITVPNNATTMHFNISSAYGGTYKNDICIATSLIDYEPYVPRIQTEITRTGKNLCEIGTATFTKSKNITLKYPIKAGITYIVSAYVESTDTDNPGRVLIGYWNNEINANPCGNNSQLERENADYYTYITPTKDITRIDLYAALSWSNGDGDTATWKDITIVPLGVDNTYEPFVEPTTYPVNADGTVDGITSISPTMNLSSNVDGVTIECKYFPQSAKDTLEKVQGITEAMKQTKNIIL